MSLDTPILVVDDSSSMRTAVRQILKEAGYSNVVLAQDGAEGLKFLKASAAPGGKKVGLILCDWAMPNMSGIELLQAVRADCKLRSTPFIMVTSEKRSECIMEAVQKGTNDFVVKPFPSTLLIEKVKKILLPPPR